MGRILSSLVQVSTELHAKRSVPVYHAVAIGRRGLTGRRAMSSPAAIATCHGIRVKRLESDSVVVRQTHDARNRLTRLPMASTRIQTAVGAITTLTRVSATTLPTVRWPNAARSPAAWEHTLSMMVLIMRTIILH